MIRLTPKIWDTQPPVNVNPGLPLRWLMILGVIYPQVANNDVTNNLANTLLQWAHTCVFVIPPLLNQWVSVFWWVPMEYTQFLVGEIPSSTCLVQPAGPLGRPSVGYLSKVSR